jgi:hypothetical protein
MTIKVFLLSLADKPEQVRIVRAAYEEPQEIDSTVPVLMASGASTPGMFFDMLVSDIDTGHVYRARKLGKGLEIQFQPNLVPFYSEAQAKANAELYIKSLATRDRAIDEALCSHKRCWNAIYYSQMSSEDEEY